MTQKDLVTQVVDDLIEKAKLLKIPQAMLLAELLYRQYDR